MDVLSEASTYVRVLRRKRPAPLEMAKRRQCEWSMLSVVGTREKIRLQTQIMVLSTETFSKLAQMYMSSSHINMQFTNLFIEMNCIC